MLIHTDVKNSMHEKYKISVDKLIRDFKESILANSNSIEYSCFLEEVRNIIHNYSLKINVDDDFINSLKFVLKMINVEVANQKNNNIKKNSNVASIIIGSALVGRGITFDNLLVTFFTIGKKNIANVDTLLQRARWFGYRDVILDYIKIFTVKKIFDDFTAIYKYDNELWTLLKHAEKNKLEFNQVDNQIVLLSNKIKPTSKAPNNKPRVVNKYYIDKIDKLSNINVDKLVNYLEKSTDIFIASNTNNSKYKYRSIKLNSIKNLYEYIDRENFASIINIEKEILSIIEFESKNYEVKVVLLDSKEDTNIINGINYREREVKFDIESQEGILSNLFQGNNPSKDKSKEYIGDSNWNKIDGEDKTIFIQVHCVKPIFKDQYNIESINSIKSINPIVLILPKDLEKKIKSYSDK